MSALQQAVARAIADVVVIADEQDVEDATAVAVRVVLAEATRSIEALPAYEGHAALAGFAGGQRNRPACEFQREALAVLAALAEDEA